MALPESGVSYNYRFHAEPLHTPWPVVDAGKPMQALSTTELEKLYLETPAVRRVIDFIARSIAVLPWHSYSLSTKDGSRERIAGDPSELLLRHPDPERGVTGYQLVRDLVTDQLIHGYCLCILLDGAPTRVPPALVVEERDFLGRLEALYVHENGSQVKVSDSPYAYVCDWHPIQGQGSFGSLRTLRGLLHEMAQAARYREVLWRESMKITSTLNLEEGKTLSRAQRQEFEERLREFKNESSSGNLILEGWEYNPVSPQPIVQQTDLSMRQITDADVASYFGVSPEVLGIRSATYGSITVFRKMLYGPTLGAHIQALQQALNLQIVPALAKSGGVVYGEFDIDSASDGSPAERAAVLQTEVGAPIKTIAEARAELNLPFIEGTDELITPLNVMAGGGDQASASDSGDQNVDTARESTPRSNEEKSWSFDASRTIVSLLKNRAQS